MTCELFVIPLNERIERLAEKLASSFLQDSEIHDLGALSGRRRSQYLVSRIYLKIILSEHYGLHGAREIALLRRDGLPPLLQPPTGIHFSISHSRDIILLAFSPAFRIAVDVEMHRSRSFLDFAGAYFHPEVHAELKKYDEIDLEVGFYEYWVRLEAGLKLFQGSVFSDFISRCCPGELSACQVGRSFSSYACQYGGYSIAFAGEVPLQAQLFLLDCSENYFEFLPLDRCMRERGFVVEA